MRGEHSSALTHSVAQRGSSPHARGALCLNNLLAGGVGIIPACAGSTFIMASIPYRVWDHPRMRGEHCQSQTKPACTVGSSPHARGARDIPSHYRVLFGIIPACAGSTASSSYLAARPGDHPRMRGEHGSYFILFYSVMGSSPHARGAPASIAARANVQGIIPACAGSTVTLREIFNQLRDHPRMRGEHNKRFNAKTCG